MQKHVCPLETPNCMFVLLSGVDTFPIGSKESDTHTYKTPLK